MVGRSAAFGMQDNHHLPFRPEDRQPFRLQLEMTDEAYFKHLDDQDIGEGPLILTEVGAYLDKSMSRDLYEGALPFKLAVGMTQADLRKTLGKPARSGDAPLFDIWPRDGLEVTARYTKDLKFAYFAVKLLRPR